LTSCHRVYAAKPLQALLVGSLSFFVLEKKSQTVRRDFSRAVPETFAMVDGRMVDGHADGRG
jgi:hypothetical protein